MTVNRVFIGLDPRQLVSYTVAQTSIIATAHAPVMTGPVSNHNTPCRRPGLTAFTWARFLVPWLCDFEGFALFVDADTMARRDVNVLFDAAKDAEEEAVSVVRNALAFERASVMLFNCEHPDNRQLTPEFVNETKVPLHKIGWTDAVADLPGEWNHLVGYDLPNPDAKIVHFTQGVPCWPETQDSEHAQEWIEYAKVSMSAQPWASIMGTSVHAAPVRERLAKRMAAE